MYKSKLTKVIVSLLRRILGVTRSGAKRLMRAMLRSLMAMGRRARLPVAGFVLPTVTMVLLVVILLTVAIVLRSFDRANTARNVRVNQQVLAAATPAIDRAKAKIQFMLYEDPQRPTATPSDAEMYRIMSENSSTSDLYKFGDEQRLILKYPVINGTTLANALDPKKPPLERIATGNQESEAINTAWRYPVDTNNDGIYDTFTLYGIFFRNPPLRVDATTGDVAVARSRKPLDARTPPMALGALDPACTTGGPDNIATLVGDSGWYKLDGKLRKSFFVYTVNVPITEKDIIDNGLDPAKYKTFTGTPSISALEYQQDQSRIPLSNNAVVYEDDLEISPGPNFNLNGRVFTNSNLLVTGLNNPRSVKLFEVSSKGSCFYDQENSKIQVAGNVVNGWTGNSTTRNPVEVHLFKEITGPDQPNTSPPDIDSTNQSITNTSLDILYNSNAFSRRLNALVQGQIDSKPLTADPVSVQLLVNPPTGSTQQPQSRQNALESYFRERLRKVPFAEVALGSETVDVPDSAVTPYTTYIQGSGDSLRPIDTWSLPTTGTAAVGSTSGPTNLTLVPTQLLSKDPAQIKSSDSEINLGERVLVGNNLPAQRWDGAKFVGATVEQQVDGSTTWLDAGLRTRKSQVTKLADVGATDRGNGWGEAPGSATPPFRDGFWEAVAAQTPQNPLDGTGGLRVITSGGVYDRTNSFLPPPRWNDGTSKKGPDAVTPTLTPATTYDDPATTAAETYPVVWPDTMPMSPLGAGSQVYDNVAGAWAAWPATATADGTGLDAAVDSTTLLSGITEQAATARKYAKGDLRMRATAVYHYAFDSYNPDALTSPAQPDQKPYACVSSYYDPSNASTARNLTGLADVSGQGGAAPYVARQAATLGDQQPFIGSNNGITYTPVVRNRPGPSTVGADGVLTGGTERVLELQASLVFPDGRFANGPLRTALLVPEAARTLAQKAAIDSTYCALDILSGTSAPAPTPTLIPDGAIQEVAFLNGREVKAIERDNNATTTVNEAFTLSSPLPPDTQAATLKVNYNQPLEEREPLEIRATQLDIDALRRNSPVGGAAGEWLLPNSGIIYASRDDALPDRSARSGVPATGLDETTSKKVSPTDYFLDPSRKPNGILLINGDYLFRGGATPTNPGTVANVVKEKGLTLVSNLPVYIQGRFNPHGRIPPATPGAPAPAFTEVEEFTRTVSSDWTNFYDRLKTELDPNFACREGDPRLPNCGGDYWRPATVLADSLTLLSARYRFGFRNEGDFDLRNNAGAEAVLRRRQRGFYNNNFVTNGLSSGAFLANGNLKPSTDPTVLTDATYASTTAPPPITSSYFNNFVTPVQRRGLFQEYVMEVCTKLPVSECGDDNWFVNPLATTPLTASAALSSGSSTYSTPTATTDTFQAGSTVDPPLAELQRFPRRIAFNRSGTNQLSSAPNPEPLAILGTTITPVTAATTLPIPTKPNSLWFVGLSGGAQNYGNTSPLFMVKSDTTDPDNTRDGSNTPIPALVAAATPSPSVPGLQGTQPLLLPFPQIRDVAAIAGSDQGGQTSDKTGWIARAENTTFNLIVGAGDTPSQSLNGTIGDSNGGVQNLPRFLESWNFGTDVASIKGSFIQLNRSAFSTAPYLSIMGATPVNSTPAEKIVSLFDQLNPTTPSLGIRTSYNARGNGDFPYFAPPNRNWGYDVGLLPQPPDLFTQKFTIPPSRSQPAEFFREVSRTDEWVKTLMCGIRDDGSTTGGTTPATSSRPTDCPEQL